MKQFRARKCEGVWVVVVGKKVEFVSEEKFGTLWECVTYCNEMNKQIEENERLKVINLNQLRLPL